jgi:hypothetical protein
MHLLFHISPYNFLALVYCIMLDPKIHDLRYKGMYCTVDLPFVEYVKMSKFDPLYVLFLIQYYAAWN